nr:hypothetical protein [Tanacetum cinerariifolium]
MVAFVILISFDYSEESVGSSTYWVILFGTIPTVIPFDVYTIAPSVLEVAVMVTPPAGIVAAPSGIPRRPAIFVLPDQEIPFDRPYRTHPNRERILLTARKRVHPFPARIPVNRKRFHSSSSSSSPRKRRRASLCSSSTATHSSSLVSARPSRKRCRDDGDIKTDTESDIDSDILADIEANIAAKAVTAIEADAIAAVEGVGDDEAEDDTKSSARERLLRLGLMQLYDHMLEFSTQMIADIVDEQRAREVRAITVDTEWARLLDKIRVLEGSVMRL